LRRVRRFLLCNTGNDNFHQLPSTARKLAGAMELSSWHQCWEKASGMLFTANREEAAQSDPVVAIGDIDNALRIVAVFCGINLQIEGERQGLRHWKSSGIPGANIFANRNTSHYDWAWVPGAEREVPFRLNAVERYMDVNPAGIVARGVSLIAEARDMLSRR
jgi:hypothetical protein